MTVTVLMCRICGWISSNIKDGRTIRPSKLQAARREFREHVKKVHGDSKEAHTQFDIVVLTNERAKEIRKVRKK